MARVSAVVAVTPSMGIGMGGTLPWRHAGVSMAGDMAYFRRATRATESPDKVNAVLMGRLTWEGIPAEHRPLKGRLNVVVSGNASWIASLPEGVLSARGLADCVDMVASDPDLARRVERIVVVGGARLFEEAALHPLCDRYHLTYMDTEFQCDTHLTEATARALAQAAVVSETAPAVENGVEWR